MGCAFFDDCQQSASKQGQGARGGTSLRLHCRRLKTLPRRGNRFFSLLPGSFPFCHLPYPATYGEGLPSPPPTSPHIPCPDPCAVRSCSELNSHEHLGEGSKGAALRVAPKRQAGSKVGIAVYRGVYFWWRLLVAALPVL